MLKIGDTIFVVAKETPESLRQDLEFTESHPMQAPAVHHEIITIQTEEQRLYWEKKLTATITF